MFEFFINALAWVIAVCFALNLLVAVFFDWPTSAPSEPCEMPADRRSGVDPYDPTW